MRIVIVKTYDTERFKGKKTNVRGNETDVEMKIKMEKPLVSIIIPVYNKEDVIKLTLDSLINQISNNIEVLLIDDGSTDKSSEICDAYAINDSRIKVIHKTNGGVSSARNTGIDICKGRYIGFIDAGDYASEDMIDSLINTLDMNASDIVSYGFNIIYGNDFGKADINQNYDTTLYKKNVLVGYVLNNSIHKKIPVGLDLGGADIPNVDGYVNSKLFSKKIINALRFDETITIGEDIVFIAEVLKNADSLTVINSNLYNYVITPGSLSRDITINSLKQLCYSADAYKNALYGYRKDLNVYVLENTLLRYLAAYNRAIGCFSRTNFQANKVINKTKEVFVDAKNSSEYNGINKKIKVLITVSLYLSPLCRIVSKIIWRRKIKNGSSYSVG